MTRALIVNADDYGHTREVARGIREAHRGGIVSSTTAMMNMPEVEEELHLAHQDAPSLGLGIHLILTSGFPLSDPSRVSSLVDETGRFWSLQAFRLRLETIRMDEVELEWRAQIDRFVRVTGKKPTHLDSHHHSSYFTPKLFELMLLLAGEQGCAIRYPFTSQGGGRFQDIPEECKDEMLKSAPILLLKANIPHPDEFAGSFYDETATRENLSAILSNLTGGVTELMCHPGYVDEILLANSSYNNKRQTELEILTDPEIAVVVEKEKIELINFCQINR